MRVLGYIFAFLFLLIGGILWGYSGSMWAAVWIAVGTFILYRSGRTKKRRLKWKGRSGNKELDELSEECFDKAVADFNALEEEKKQIKDKELKKQLQKMQDIAWRFLRYLQEHPEKIGMARRFVDYYQDRALSMVRRYQDLEKTGLKTEEIENAKWKIKDVLNSFDEAYEAQFTKVLNAQIMDLDAELKVMKQAMKADGIQDEAEETPSQKTLPHGNGAALRPNFWGTLLKDAMNEGLKELLDETSKKKRG